MLAAGVALMLTATTSRRSRAFLKRTRKQAARILKDQASIIGDAVDAGKTAYLQVTDKIADRVAG